MLAATIEPDMYIYICIYRYIYIYILHGSLGSFDATSKDAAVCRTFSSAEL